MPHPPHAMPRLGAALLAALLTATPVWAASAPNDMNDIGQTASSVATEAGKLLTDAALTARVRAALLKDEQVPSMRIAVSTREQAVTLSGYVDTQKQAWRAAETAAKVDGVVRVDNQLSLKPQRPDSSGAASGEEVGAFLSDAAITGQIKAKFLATPGVPFGRITVHTDNGVVTLSGYVSFQQQAERAVDIAKGVRDVKSVKNELKVL